MTDNLVWETVPCDWCGATDELTLFEGPDRLLHRPGRFRLVQCRVCGLMRQNPRLAWESLQTYYEGDYISYASLIRDEPRAWRRLDRRYGMWKQMRVVERAKPGGGRLLDVGSGTGIFLEEALRSRRWQVMGVEPTEAAARYSAKALGCEVVTGRFSEVQLPEADFDVITLWNVIEHLPSPTADLRRACQLLRPDGRLVFTVPNVESVEARVFGRHWVGWDLPRHLYLFPRATLHHMLRGLGLEIEFEACISSSHSALRDTLEFWSQAWSSGFGRFRQPMRTLYNSLPARLALGPPFWLLDRLKRSTILTLVVRKATPPLERA